MAHCVSINGRAVGPQQPPYIIAEMSGNHRGDLKVALNLLEAVAMTGADAVKLQTYTADTITIDHDGPEFRITDGPWGGRTLYELYREAHTPWDWHEPLFAKARELGLTIFSSPFDDTAVELLEGLNAPAYKIASFELVDLPLIRRCAATHKPLIISTGMANLAEIHDAVSTARKAGCHDIILLHCVSSYPALPGDYNLRTLPHLGETFDTVVGVSDHTLGCVVPIVSVSLGASVVEKHFTLRRSDGGPDAAFSLEPEEFTSLVRDCRNAYAAMGRVSYRCEESEAGNTQFRRSLYAVENIRKGESFTPHNVRSIRPSHGLPPRHFEDLMTRCAREDIHRGTPLSWDLVGPRRKER